MKKIQKALFCFLFSLFLTPCAFAQSAPADAPPVKQPLLAAPKSAESPKSVAVPAEMQELLADRALLVNEIERIATAAGEAVKIPVSLRELQARLKTKTDRYLAWLDAQKIPREWDRKGWRLDKWVFIPPTNTEEKKP